MKVIDEKIIEPRHVISITQLAGLLTRTACSVYLKQAGDALFIWYTIGGWLRNKIKHEAFM